MKKTNFKASKRILYGNEAFPLKKITTNNTHNWILFLRPYNDNDIELYNVIEYVTFHLHESFANPHRKITQPPYILNENGWGEFEVLIEIQFKFNFGNLFFHHFLMLFSNDKNKKGNISNVSYDELLFINPPLEIRELLSYKPNLPEKWNETPKQINPIQEEKENLNRVLKKMKNELKELEKQYHDVLSEECKDIITNNAN